MGTIRKNKIDVPAEFQPNKQRKVNSTVFGFTDDRTKLSFVPKKGRTVIMLFYNSTKTGDDSLD